VPVTNLAQALRLTMFVPDVCRRSQSTSLRVDPLLPCSMLRSEADAWFKGY
jgi:hypothetical protein